MTDVNVTEKVIDALVMSPLADTAGTDLAPFRRAATAALAALRDPDVLAGMAGVLREHDLIREAYRDPSYGPGIVCRCGAVIDQALDETMQETQARHEAAAVVEWLTERDDR